MNPKLKITLILLLAIVILAGAAYLAMIYIVPNFNPSGGPGGNGQHTGGISITQIRAPQLPAQEADLTGEVTGVKDNSIFVAPVNSISVSPMGGGQQLPTPAGPYTEVLITQDTKIWRDVTDNDAAVPAAGSSGANLEVQQKLETTDSTALTAGASTFVEVWGQKQGGRLTADVIVMQ